MSQQNLRNILQFLATFERAPKDIQGRQITEWFKVGEALFTEFYHLGINTGWNSATLKGKPEVGEIVQGLTRNQNWLQSFVTIYPNIRIDLDGCFSPAEICKVRSGLHFLLLGFQGISAQFNKVLQDLQEFGELEEFDGHLKAWVETGHRPDFFPGDRHSSVPTSHWWWF